MKYFDFDFRRIWSYSSPILVSQGLHSLIRKTPKKGPGKRELISGKKHRIARGRTGYKFILQKLFKISVGQLEHDSSTAVFSTLRYNKQKLSLKERVRAKCR